MQQQPGAQQVQPMPSGQNPNVFQQSANNLTNASTAATNAAFYQPQQVNTNFQAQQVGPNATMTQGYFNPYQQQVVDQSLADIERSRQMAVNDTGASATAAGAFGGSRHGVAEGMTNEAFARTAADTAAGLNMQGFNTSQQLAQQAALANQQAGLQAQGMGLQAQGMNQSAGLQAANLGLAGASTLGNLSGQGFNQGMAITNQQAAMGAQQQALNQAIMDAAAAQYQGFTGSPQQSLAMLLGGAQVPTGRTSTQTMQPGLFDWLTLGAMI